MASFSLIRVLLLKYLGFLYFIAYLISWTQNGSLIGEHGLTPARIYMKRLGESLDSRGYNSIYKKFNEIPTIFWMIEPSSEAIEWLSLTGLIISSFIMINGSANMIMLFFLWFGYLSVVNIGQVWYSFGWESQLLETGFLAIFLSPMYSIERLPQFKCPWLVIIGYRWLIFRIMLGAGLIKIRGDSCWRDYTCMNFHYQTQPVPNPLSPYYHISPEWFHRLEVLVNHIIELVFPFLVFFPRQVRILAGAAQIIFQAILISSGNLSFLNWLTVLPAIACFDDECIHNIPMFMRTLVISKSDVKSLQLNEKEYAQPKSLHILTNYFRVTLHAIVACLLLSLSIPVISNLLSSQQMMNTSYNSYRILNTYGAFGTVTRQRFEVVLQGTSSPEINEITTWIEYNFHCKPGDINRRPCIISPYHYRLDWLMWFSAFQSYQQCPWLVHLAWKLLKNDSFATKLISSNPFVDVAPPKFIRAELYEYQYNWNFPAVAASGINEIPNTLDSKIWIEGRWWRRRWERNYMPPISLDNPSALNFLEVHHFIN